MASKSDQFERQRTRLQRRKISAAIKLDRIQRYDGAESVKEEVIQELEREYDVTKRLLRDLETSAESQRRREIQTLRRFGVLDTGIRYSLPELEIDFDARTTPMANRSGPSESDNEEEEDEEDDDQPSAKKRGWKPLNWLPIFRGRSGSEVNRKYRAMSADVLAFPSTSVQNLRSLYTGRSEFYEADEQVDCAAVSRHRADSTKKEGRSEFYLSEAAIGPSANCRTPKRGTSIDRQQLTPIDPRALNEIQRFETLILEFFKQQPR